MAVFFCIWTANCPVNRRRLTDGNGAPINSKRAVARVAFTHPPNMPVHPHPLGTHPPNTRFRSHPPSTPSRTLTPSRHPASVRLSARPRCWTLRSVHCWIPPRACSSTCRQGPMARPSLAPRASSTTVPWGRQLVSFPPCSYKAERCARLQGLRASQRNTPQP